MEALLNKLAEYSSRKLAVAIGLAILATYLLMNDHINGQTWSSFMSLNVVGYMIGNVGEHIAKK